MVKSHIYIYIYIYIYIKKREKRRENPTGIKLCISRKIATSRGPPLKSYCPNKSKRECPPREHQGEGLHSVFQTFAENPFLYLGMIVNAIVYVRLRWCVC